MKISGFSYIRNGFTYGYPFLESMQSILPLCNEFVIAVGDSNDGTREAIQSLNSPKIKIIDTVWDEKNLREGGKIFAQQANIARDAITGDWGFHLQADEVIHENDLEKIRTTLQNELNNLKVEGFLFPFLNFFGSYEYIGTTRRWHRYEVRVIRNIKNIHSYNDSQGFRMFFSPESSITEARKLKVKLINATVYHYNYARNPKLMQKKAKYFHRFWHEDKWIEENIPPVEDFDYSDIDDLKKFKGVHPMVMKKKIEEQDWNFIFDRRKTNATLREKFLNLVEEKTGWRIGEYQNYQIIK